MAKSDDERIERFVTAVEALSASIQRIEALAERMAKSETTEKREGSVAHILGVVVSAKGDKQEEYTLSGEMSLESAGKFCQAMWFGSHREPANVVVQRYDETGMLTEAKSWEFYTRAGSLFSF